MRLTRLRIAGFKTFVEPTDIPIEPGLTGVVGPNGCGKSNLVEALRWVMGESSHKNMRASGMDDVIFAGSSTRPARNRAEVTLAIDNTDRVAPAAFNDSDRIEVSRRIEREQGSSYRVNGREVRARDVQLLFADAATGARSPALVRQGQISELIAAKPQSRRRILEDAAGIAGLHARRHEAELRMRQAEDNLVRVEDVLREIEAQVDALRRQDRQAARYRVLSAEIRRLEAELAASAWRAAERDRADQEAAEREDVRAVADRTAEQAEAAREQALAAHEIGPLREREVAAAAVLRRLAQARTDLDGEERRATERLADVERRLAEIDRDAGRQSQAGQDAASTIARLEAETRELTAGRGSSAARRLRLADGLAAAGAGLATADDALAAAQATMAEISARRDSLSREAGQEREAAARADREGARLRQERVALAASRASLASGPLRTARDAAETANRAEEEAVPRARLDLAAARERESRERAASGEAERAAQRLETELRTLRKLFSSETAAGGATLLDAIAVAPGHEAAVAAAFGDDLDASSDPAAPLSWRDTGEGLDDPPLPEGAVPLADVVTGPAALARRLRQIGLVGRAGAAALAPRLRAGQRLVSAEGDLWRWDGLVARAEAPSPAARRLAARNRLAALARDAEAARAIAEDARAAASRAEAATRTEAGREAAALDAARRTRRALDEARDSLARAERAESERAVRLAALDDAVLRLEAGRRDTEARAADLGARLEALPDDRVAARALSEARRDAAERRGAVTDLRANLASLDRDQETTARRLAALAADLRLWRERGERAGADAIELVSRRAAATTDRAELRAAPETFLQRRRALGTALAEAETARSEAADRLARAEARLAEGDRAARAALDALAAARERRAASAARSEGLGRRVAELARGIADAFGTDPAGLMALTRPVAGSPGDPVVDPAAVEARLGILKADRERLGSVNLRAEDELAESTGKRDRLSAERDDLVEAIKRLRQAVGSLNREGRERLRAAFGIVNGHFGRLFTTLFGGGEAELALVDSDDPLEAGLEITACPPGKRPQILSLLSGGEQALTATALIFAVFLTNPSPICVLDEVDAPLDDANVERYCDLLRAMAGETDTRFVVITHNPITMARMDRLFGVTMAERGISQVVSVDLEAAERLREAG